MTLADQLRKALRGAARLFGRAPADEESGSSRPPRPELAPLPAPIRAPLTDEEREVLMAARRCDACGVCDEAFDGYYSISRPDFAGPMAFVLGTARATLDHGAAYGAVRSLARGDLVALTRACPRDVPFVALAEVVRERAERLAPPPLPVAADPARPKHDPG